MEISTSLYGVNLHILGYSRNFNLETLSFLLETNRKLAFTRIGKILIRLKEAGIADISIDDLQEKKGQGVILSKYDIQKELEARFEVILKDSGLMVNKKGGVAYEPYNAMAMICPEDIIKIIRQANGIAVLAHPCKILNNANHRVMWKIISELIEMNIDGIEVYSSRSTKEQEKMFLSVCDKAGLIKTGGSDSHGAIHTPDRMIGSVGINNELWQEFLTRLPS